MSIVLEDEKDIVDLYDKVDLVLDWSRQTVFDRCRQEAYFVYEEGYESMDSNKHLDFGTKFHEHVENNDIGVWNGFREQGDSRYDFKIKSKGEDLGKLYIEHYLEQDRANYEFVCWEKPLAVVIDVDGRSVLVKGHIDQLMRHKDTGHYWIKDLKTTSGYVNDSIYFTGWTLGGQGGYYTYLVDEWLKSRNLKESVGGVIVDVVMAKRLATDESDIKRKILEASEIDWQGPWDIARDWLMEKDRNVWRRSESACVRYNSRCPVYLICKNGDNNYWERQAKLVKKQANDWHK